MGVFVLWPAVRPNAPVARVFAGDVARRVLLDGPTTRAAGVRGCTRLPRHAGPRPRRARRGRHLHQEVGELRGTATDDAVGRDVVPPTPTCRASADRTKAAPGSPAHLSRREPAPTRRPHRRRASLARRVLRLRRLIDGRTAGRGVFTPLA